ncbi:Uncharacterized protein Fot_32522 [Forsythia ovata]|uniref:Uncharacterized protein n=1 Tax=Forsythia ovata TaxID=205694 RepID=A0ABD1T819_9LAMI
MTSLALVLALFEDEDDEFLGSFRNTEDNLEKEKYLDDFFILFWTLLLMYLKSSTASSATELGLEDSGWRSWLRSLEKEEWESVDEPVESREEVVVVSEEDEEEARRRVRTMERRGERWRGRI